MKTVPFLRNFSFTFKSDDLPASVSPMTRCIWLDSRTIETFSSAVIVEVSLFRSLMPQRHMNSSSFSAVRVSLEAFHFLSSFHNPVQDFAGCTIFTGALFLASLSLILVCDLLAAPPIHPSAGLVKRSETRGQVILRDVLYFKET